MGASAAFLELFAHRSPSLRAKFWVSSEEAPTNVTVSHRLGSAPDRKGLACLESIRSSALNQFCDFYGEHDGLEFCRTHDARHGKVRPLLEFMSARQLQGFTNRYRGKGDRAWTMDLNKSRSIYRGPHSWIVFAEIDSGPACLTIFLDGENAGRIFFATPQPWFNILRPIAKDFDGLLSRIASDPAAFLRLIRATVSMRGADGQNYGFTPIEYHP